MYMYLIFRRNYKVTRRYNIGIWNTPYYKIVFYRIRFLIKHSHHIAFDRPVAIKEFFPHQSVVRDGAALMISIDMPQQNDYFKALDRFMKEGRTLYDLTHPNVVRVHDLFRFNNTAYIVMELIEGRTLREILDASLDK